MLESLDALELLIKWWKLRGSCSGGIVGCGSHGSWVLCYGLLMVAQWWHGHGGSSVWCGGICGGGVEERKI